PPPTVTSTLSLHDALPIFGVIMIFYVIYGGMKGTTWVQIIKAVMLIIGAGIMTLWVLSKFGFNLSTLLGEATQASQDAGGKDLRSEEHTSELQSRGHLVCR